MKDFNRVRKGYNPKEVEELIEAKEIELEEAQKRIDALNGDLKITQMQLEKTENLDEDTLTEMLGTSAARLLNTARKEAEAKEKEAEGEAEEIISQAKREADEIHAQAEMAFTERIAAAKAEAEKLEAEAQSVRHKTLLEMNRERKEAKAEVQRLKAGRDKLLNSINLSQNLVDEIKNSLTHSLSDAKIAADNAARRVMSQPDPSPEEIEEEVAAARLLEIPGSSFYPESPFSVEADTASIPSTSLDPQISPAPQMEDDLIAEKQETEMQDIKEETREENIAEEFAVESETQKKNRWNFLRKPKEDEAVEEILSDGASSEQEVFETTTIEDFQITEVPEKQALQNSEQENIEPEQVEPEQVETEEDVHPSEESDSTESIFERLRAEQESAKKEPEKVEPEIEPAHPNGEIPTIEKIPTIDLQDFPVTANRQASAPADELGSVTPVLEETTVLEEEEEEKEDEEEHKEYKDDETAAQALAGILERQLKQAMALDQNQVLDLLRQKRKKELPPIESQTDVYISAINTEEMDKIAEIKINIPETLLLEHWVQPLRSNLENCFTNQDEGKESEKEKDLDVPKAIRNSYRNFKQNECSKIALELSKKVLEMTPQK